MLKVLGKPIIAGFALALTLPVGMKSLAATDININKPRISTSTAPKQESRWIGTWATSPQAPWSDKGFTNQTVRMIIHPHLDGKKLRIRLSNTFGEKPLTFGKVHVAISNGNGKIVPGTDHQVTFDGSQSVTIPVGQEIKSDPVSLAVKSGQNLVISCYVPGDSGPATWHFNSNQDTYISDEGDHTADIGTSDYPSKTGNGWYWLDGVDVLADPSVKGAVVALGDSITDGWKSTPNANHRWPDYLADRFNQEPVGKQMSVLNEGITGNRILSDSPNYGVKALDRLGRDAFNQTGVTDVILVEGINDIGQLPHTTDPQKIIDGMKQMIDQSHEHGLKIYGATISPCQGANIVYGDYYTPEGEKAREAVNSWIRTSGAFDGVIDFDKLLRDPNNPLMLNPKYDSGDHLHPSDEGYKAMADSINLSMLEHK
jgi:lysophospholipase L1-like esterase